MDSKMPKTLHTCWIKNISSKFNKEDLQQYFIETASKYSSFYKDTCNMSLSKEHDCYQCWLNFESEKDAKDAVNHFNKCSLEGKKLEANYMKPKEIKVKEKSNQPSIKLSAEGQKAQPKDLNSTSSSDDNEPIVEMKNIKFTGVLMLSYPTCMLKFYVKKKLELEDANTTIEAKTDKNGDSILEFYVYSNNKASFEKAINEIKSWKSFEKNLKIVKLDEKYFQRLNANNEALRKKINEIDKEAYVFFNPVTSEVLVHSRDDRNSLLIQGLIVNFNLNPNYNDETDDSSGAISESGDDNKKPAKFNDKVTIKGAKFLKAVILKKVKKLEDKKTATKIYIKGLGNKSFDLEATVSSNDEQLCKKAAKEISSWKTYFDKRELDENELKIIKDWIKTLKKKAEDIDEDANIELMHTKSTVFVHSLSKDSLGKIMAMIEKILIDNCYLFISFEAGLQDYVQPLNDFLKKTFKVHNIEPFMNSESRSESLKNSSIALCCISKKFCKNSECINELKTLVRRGSVIIILYEDIDLGLLDFELNCPVIKLSDYKGSRKSWTDSKAERLVRCINDCLITKK